MCNYPKILLSSYSNKKTFIPKAINSTKKYTKQTNR